MRTTHIDLFWTLAIALGVHALVGFNPFPNIDDFAYAVLAEAAADPALFARDDQVTLFANHAYAYSLVYGVSKATIGVGVGFWIATVALCVGCVFAMRSVLRALETPSAGLLIALGLSVLVVHGGIGRGDYGALISDSFHHQGVAMCVVLWALAASLHERPIVAGLCIGLAAFAQPVTALLGAGAVGCCALSMPGERLRRIGTTALVSIIAALPIALRFAGMITGAPESPTGDLVDSAYRFRAPGHYDIPSTDLLLIWAYAGLGLISTLALSDRLPRAALGLAGAIGGLALTQLVTTLVYSAGLFEWLPFFILDTTRITPLLFVLSALAFVPVAAKIVEDRAVTRGTGFACGIVLLILVLNNTLAGVAVLVFGVVLLAVKDMRAVTLAVAGASLAVFTVFAAVRPLQSPIPDGDAALFAWVKSETSPDALFVIPPAMHWFRHYAQRSIYADFKLFSVAQPDQAALTRERLMEMAPSDPDLRQLRGWEGVRQWADHFAANARCDDINDMLTRSGADFYVLDTKTRAGVVHGAPKCGGDPALVFETDGYAAYASRTVLASAE